MEIKSFKHEGESLSTSIILEQSEVLEFRERVRDVLTAINKDQKPVDVFLKDFNPQGMAKSELVELITNTFTIDELAIMVCCNNIKGLKIIMDAMQDIVKGEFLTDFTHSAVVLEKQLIREEQGITSNPFDKLNNLDPFI